MTHTKECDKYVNEARKEVEAYISMWPNYCNNCSGSGGFYYPGSYWQPPDFEPCDECVGKGKCPRCGAESFTDDSFNVCSSCQFSLTDGIGMPSRGECICEY